MLKPTNRILSMAGACLLFPLLVLPAQDPAPPRANDAVIPVPREGGPHARYLKLNEIVRENQGTLDLAFIGDSITQGWETNGREVWQKFYSSRKAVNLGISGDRTQHVLWRLDNGNVEGIRPKVTMLMIGTNNSADDRNSALEMTEGVQAVVRRIREKLPETRILLLGIFPRGEDFNPQRGKILQVNQVIRKLDDGFFVHYLDIGHLFLSPEGKIAKEIMPDFLHLTPKGYELWAEAIEPKIRELLGASPTSAGGEGPSGAWILRISPPSGEQVELVLRLEVDGARIQGSVEAPDGRQLEVENGELNGSRISFTIRRARSSGKVYLYEAKGELDGDQMRGTLLAVGEGQTMEWSARRKR